MRLKLSTYVTVERDEGRSIYVCRPWRGPQCTSRDPLLGNALAKLGNKMRRSINDWIHEGRANRVRTWLYDAQVRTRVSKLTLALRDRTLRWKILLVTVPAFERLLAFSPSLPEVTFEVASLAELESRATEVFTEWAQSQLTEGESELASIGGSSDMWVEPIEVDVEASVRNKRKPRNALAALFGNEKMSGMEELHKVGQCLDEMCDNFEIALGRGDLVAEVDRMLSREDRQGVLLVGPTAVGKTAILEECVKRRVRRFERRRGHKPQVWRLSPQRLISGMSYLGQWEQRWLAILREANKRDHVLVLDDLVGLFSAGRTRDSSLSAADVLRSYLSEHRVRILAEATDQQLAILRRRDRALADQLHLVHVPALSAEESLPTVLQAITQVESRTGRFFHPETVPLIMRHQEIFAPDRAFPGKAIEMIKTLAKHSRQVVDRGTFYQLAGNQIGANLMLLVGRFGDQRAINNMLSEQLIGQPAAVDALSKIVVRFAQHLQPTDRPLGVVLLLGPTGVGKTESAKALTRLLYNDDSHLVRLDMNEMTTPYAAEQLVGTFDQPEGRLTSAVRRRPNCVILLDEIEKAHPDVFDYLLQVIGEGRLTDARGRVADFRSSIILLTSNLGAAEQSSNLGFEKSPERQSRVYVKAAESFFRPEFFNRLDEVIAFRTLDGEDMREIVCLQMKEVLSREGLRRRDIFVNVTEVALQRVIQTGFDPQLGARSVRRKLEREIIGPLGDCLSSLRVVNPALVHITAETEERPIACHVTPLNVVHGDRICRCTDLERALEAGEALHDQLEQRLVELAPELNARDAEQSQPAYNASYYALREYLHRCTDLIKAGKERLRHQLEPKLAPPATPVTRPKRDSEGPGARRYLLDWQAQEDLRLAIREDSTEGLSSTDDAQLAFKIVDAIATAAAMIEHALAPRNWLIGFTPLSSSSLGEASERGYWRRGRDYEIYAPASSADDFLARLINGLKHGWQYEVVADERLGSFQYVAGAALPGLIQPLLGTYRTRGTHAPNELFVFRAMPLPDDRDASTWDEHLSAVADQLMHQPLIDGQGRLQTPAEQIFPTDRIRGEIGERVMDFVSGSELELIPNNWMRPEQITTATIEWWTRCLPVPSELLEA